MAPFMTYCIEQFGPSRCMFESNFPVDKVSYSYNVLYNAFKRLSKGYSAVERAAMFHDTAARVYRIDVWTAAITRAASRADEASRPNGCARSGQPRDQASGVLGHRRGRRSRCR